MINAQTQFDTYKQRIYEITELTDKEIYKTLLDTIKPNNNIKLIPQKTSSPFDVLQITPTSKDLIELKIRHKYTYRQFDDISIDLYKIQRIQKILQSNDYNGAYIAAFFPKDNKAVLIDITNIEYNEEDIVYRKANKQTIDYNPQKQLKSFIPLNIKQKRDNKLNTKNYHYTLPELKDKYKSIFKKYCNELDIPVNIQDEALKNIIN